VRTVVTGFFQIIGGDRYVAPMSAPHSPRRRP
jgi:hypothetical protein